MKNNIKKILLVSLISICGTGTALAAVPTAPQATKAPQSESGAHKLPFSSTITDWLTFAYKQGFQAGQDSKLGLLPAGTPVNFMDANEVYAWGLAQFPDQLSHAGASNLKQQITQSWNEGMEAGAASM